MKTSVGPETLYSVVNLTTNSATVCSGPCLLVGVSTQTAISAHNCPIKDGSTTVIQVPASAPMGNWYEGGYARFETSLVVDPDDSASGTIVVFYIPNHEGLAA